MGLTTCFGLETCSSLHSVADAGDVMSSNLDPSSALVDSLDSSLALEVFLALSRYLLKEANSTTTTTTHLSRQPRMAFTKC